LDKIQDVDFISVTTHPWLPGSLVVGKALASFLAAHFDKPLVEVNHVYGHLFSLLLERNVNDIQFPLVVLTASGWHNDLYFVDSLKLKAESIKKGLWALPTGQAGSSLQLSASPLEDIPQMESHTFGGYTIIRIWKTLDDAAGECFDKVARMLGGPYPGGARIAERASRSWKVEGLKGWKVGDIIPFKRIFLSKDNYEFSFSWMKSQVSFLLKQLEKNWTIERLNDGKIKIPEELICDIAYEFQEAVVEVLVKKLVRAWIQYEAKTIGVAWGVSCNDRLREYLNEYWKLKIETWKLLRPIKKVYSTDNGAMIWLAGILEYIN
jgi:N6-L-threonylcarbamoyladenine synthase